MDIKRTRFRTVGIVLGIVGILALLGGCADNSPSGGAASSSTTKPSPSTSSSAKRSQMTALANAKTTAKYFDAQIEVMVKNVTLDFFPDGYVLGDPKDEGKQFVRIELAVTNKGKEPFDVNSTTFSLQTSANKKGETYTFLINDGNAKDFLVDKKLNQGESTSGALYFEAPAADKLDTLMFAYEGYDGNSKVYTIPLKP